MQCNASTLVVLLIVKHIISSNSGVATIEATEAAASVKILNNRLSRPEFWHP